MKTSVRELAPYRDSNPHTSLTWYCVPSSGLVFTRFSARVSATLTDELLVLPSLSRHLTRETASFKMLTDSPSSCRLVRRYLNKNSTVKQPKY